jgi:hypothetical protein
MRVKTISGSIYEFKDSLCTKFNKEGEIVDSFKFWSMKPVPDEVIEMSQLYLLPEGKPEVGKRLYVSSRYSWWLSTQVVSIEK